MIINNLNQIPSCRCVGSFKSETATHLPALLSLSRSSNILFFLRNGRGLFWKALQEKIKINQLKSINVQLQVFHLSLTILPILIVVSKYKEKTFLLLSSTLLTLFFLPLLQHFYMGWPFLNVVIMHVVFVSLDLYIQMNYSISENTKCSILSDNGDNGRCSLIVLSHV